MNLPANTINTVDKACEEGNIKFHIYWTLKKKIFKPYKYPKDLSKFNTLNGCGLVICYLIPQEKLFIACRYNWDLLQWVFSLTNFTHGNLVGDKLVAVYN